jgi:hypothetical protein
MLKRIIPLLPEEGTKGWREKSRLIVKSEHHPVLRTPLLAKQGGDFLYYLFT